MPRQIIISSTAQEARVAVMENARLIEIFIERVRERGVAGSIYKGRVTRVLPGMQAAFVDIGLPKAAFLHASDFHRPGDEGPPLSDVAFDAEGPAVAGDAETTGSGQGSAPPPIEERLQKGQELIVQISKEPIGTKGARVTSHISVPGRYLVFLPFTDHVGVSRRIASEEERERLRQAVEATKPAGVGIIVRTAGEGVTKREVQSDLRLLRKLWARIEKKADSAAAPALLHGDLDLILRSIRDLLSNDVTRVVIDHRRDYQRVLEFIDTVMSRSRPRVELYELAQPVFERYGIEAQIAKALERKVWLKSGGHIVIDHTEALTTIDVNTGRYVGKTNQEETVLRTNLEAARVVVDQLRLRNIGGLIVIDFIDMERSEHRKAVLAGLTEALKSDKARTNILGISELGLVEMTRQRTRESLAQRLCEPCPTCGGKGRVKATSATAYELLRRIRREATVNGPLRQIAATVHPDVAAFLEQHEATAVRELERELQVQVILHRAVSLGPGEYDIRGVAAVT